MTVSPEEIRRLNSWAGVIAQSLRPDSPFARTAEGIRLGRKGSLSITADARWFDHEVGTGGHDALSLIRLLRGCSSEAAIFWALRWLEQHLGDCDLHVEVDAEAVAETSARRTAWALQVLDDATDPFGTPAEAGRVRQHAIQRCAGNARDGGSVSLVRPEVLTSTSTRRPFSLSGRPGGFPTRSAGRSGRGADPQQRGGLMN